MSLAHFGEHLRQLTEDFPIRAALPHGVDGFAERMEERMHIGRRDVLLLVPCGGGQDDVGEDT